MLHYLKPRHYGLHVRRGQERFVDTEFRHRELFAYSCEAYSRVVLHGERKSRIAFADKMQQDAFSFPSGEMEEAAALVLVIAIGAAAGTFITKGLIAQQAANLASSMSLDLFDATPPGSLGGAYLAMTEADHEK